MKHRTVYEVHSLLQLFQLRGKQVVRSWNVKMIYAMVLQALVSKKHVTWPRSVALLHLVRLGRHEELEVLIEGNDALHPFLDQLSKHAVEWKGTEKDCLCGKGIVKNGKNEMDRTQASVPRRLGHTSGSHSGACF